MEPSAHYYKPTGRMKRVEDPNKSDTVRGIVAIVHNYGFSSPVSFFLIFFKKNNRNWELEERKTILFY